MFIHIFSDTTIINRLRFIVDIERIGNKYLIFCIDRNFYITEKDGFAAFGAVIVFTAYGINTVFTVFGILTA